MDRRHFLALPAALASGLAAIPADQPDPDGVTRTHALSLLGTPSLPRDFTHFPWVNPEAPKGGEIVLGALGSFDSLNGFILRGTAAVGLGNLYDTLLKPNTDEPTAAYAHLARSIELPADRLSVTFVLDERARWHDGRPVTAADAAWTFDMLRTQGRPNFRAYWADVTECVAEDARRVRFRFRTAENRELPLILGELPVLPKHWWETRDFTRPILEAPLGSGAFRIERFEAGRGITYARAPDYWARDLGTMKGTANWDRIRHEYYRDTTVAFEAFKAGQIDFRQENVARDWATGYDFPAFRRGLVKREELRHEIPTGMQAFAMNQRRPLFQDGRVRRALIEVFDFEWMNANLFYGAYARTTSYFSNSEFAATGLPEGAELAVLEPFRTRLPPLLFTEPYRLPVTDGSGNNREALRRALELLRQAGWTVRDRRLVNAQGQPFQFEILIQGATFERVALPYVQALERLGIAARVRTVDPAQYQVRIESFDYDMTVDSMGQSLSPGNEQRDYFTCEKARENGSQNVAGICDPVVDAMVDLVVNAPDRDALVARTRALDRVLLWGNHVIPNWHLRSFRIAWWDKFGKPAQNPRYGIGLESWWVDATRQRALDAARQ